MPAQPRQRRAEHPGERAGDHRTEHRDADEHAERTEADRAGLARTGQAHGDERRAADGDERADDGAALRRAGAVDGDVAQRLDRRHLAALRAGRYAATTVTTMPTTIDDR